MRPGYRKLGISMDVPRIYHVYTSNDIPCISMDTPGIYLVQVGRYTWYFHGYIIYIHSVGYAWYIHGYTTYVPRILVRTAYTCNIPSGIRIVSYVRHISGICLTYSKFLHMSGIHLEYTSMPKARISLVSMHARLSLKRRKIISSESAATVTVLKSL